MTGRPRRAGPPGPRGTPPRRPGRAAVVLPLLTGLLGVGAGSALAAPDAPPTSEVVTYRDPLAAWHERRRTLIELSAVLPRLDVSTRDGLLQTLDSRLEDVRRDRHLLLRRIDDPDLDLADRDRMARELDLLSQEEATLVTRQALLRATAPSSSRDDTPGFRDDLPVALRLPSVPFGRGHALAPVPPATEDRIHWGDRTVVAAGERVRRAIAIGGDVIVFGTVEGEVAAIGGDVLVAHQAQLSTPPLVWGGVIRHPLGHAAGASQPPPPGTWSDGTLAATLVGGLGLVGAGFGPALASRAGRRVLRHPIRAAGVGALATLALAVAAIALVLPGWTAPLALAVPIAALGAGATGVFGVALRAGEWAVPDHPTVGAIVGLGLTVAASGGLIAWLPWLAWGIAVPALVVGLGAILGAARPYG